VPRVSVLYIGDALVGPHLELIRNVCEPDSKSAPHVTVRYFDRLRIPPDHLKHSITHIDLLEPASFGLEPDSKQSNRTIFIRCHSEELIALEHKPNFPTSEFHVTLYDGASTTFAQGLLDLLKRYRWSYRLRFSPAQRLQELQIRPRKRRRAPTIQPQTERQYRPAVRELYRRIVGQDLSYQEIVALPEAGRLKLVRRICEHLAPLTVALEHVKTPRRDFQFAVDETWKPVDPEVHLTPPELASSIATYALSHWPKNQPINFGDPAVGTGAFFAALLHATGGKSPQSAVGVEISAKQADAAQWRWQAKGLKVVCEDYLHMETLAPRNLILANPPYLRHQEIDKEYKSKLRQRASVILGRQVSALSGQYVYFMLLSHSWMEPGALAAWLIPTEFMKARYGDALRFYLTHLVTPIRIHQYDRTTPQFEGARVLPSVVVFRNQAPEPDHKCQLTVDGTLEEPEYGEFVSVQQLRELGTWAIPLSRPQTGVRSVRVGDLFETRRGIATGANHFFVLDREHAKQLGIPSSCVRPLLPRARSLTGDTIEAKHDGYPDVPDQLCVIDCGLPMEEIERRHPAFAEYLNAGIREGVTTGHLIHSRRPWYRQEQRAPAPFVCTYMGRETSSKSAIRFFWNKSAAIATNTYLLLYPRPTLRAKLEKSPRMHKVMVRALNDAAASTLVGKSRLHADGLEKIELSDLREVELVTLPLEIQELAEPALL